ncbi:MAG: hypothetical protein AB7E61_06430 [Acholeplasmataceae bacterium]
MSYPTDKLWLIFKDLLDINNESIPVFKGEKDSDDDVLRYIVIQDEQYDEAIHFGDGKPVLRNSDFNLYLNTINADDLIDMKRAVITKLDENNIYYTIANKVYDSNSKFYTLTFEGSLQYV